jgi:ribosomal protein S1
VTRLSLSHAGPRSLTIGTCVLTVRMRVGVCSASTDGLVHVSQLADDFVKDIASVVKVGDDVQVRITEINVETNKVSLSMRSENAKPQKSQGAGGEGKKQGGGGRKEIPEEFKNMDDKTIIKGTVSSVTEYGAFVTLAEGVDGLVHVSQLSEGRVESAAKFVKVGQEVDVRIISFDSKKGNLSLSMKAWTEPAPRDETEDIKSFMDEAPKGQTAFEIAWAKAQAKVAA